MALSTQTTLSYHRDDIINQALYNAGLVNHGASPSGRMSLQGQIMANQLLKTLETSPGPPSWSIVDIYIFPVAKKDIYDLSPTGDRATEKFIQTSLSAAAVATDTSISVNSISGVAVDDHIGILLDTGRLHWSTVTDIPGDIEFADALPSDVSERAKVYTYTTQIQYKPLRLIDDETHYRQWDGRDYPIRTISRNEYNNLPDKREATGTPYHAWMDVATGLMRIWQPASDEKGLIWSTVQRPLYIFETGSNDPDMPDYYIEAFIWELSYMLSVSFKTSPEVQVRCENMRREKGLETLAYDGDKESLYLYPITEGF